MTDIKRSYNIKKLDEVTHFFRQVSAVPITTVYFLKSVNDEKQQLVLPKLKKVLDSNWSFRLLFFEKQYPFDFERLDSEGVVTVAHHYYETYFVTNSENASWFIVLQNNNFHPDGNNLELVYARKTTAFNLLWRFFGKQLYKKN